MSDLPSISVPIPEFESIELVAYPMPHEPSHFKASLQTKRWCVRNIKESWNILDTGTGFGLNAILFAKLASKGRVTAFEAPETVEMARENFDLHKLTNLSVCEVALCGRLKSDHGIEDRLLEEGSNEPRLVETTIDQQVSLLDLKRLDLLSIDGRSLNLEVLNGALRTLTVFNPVILLDFSEAEVAHPSGWLLDWFSANGYQDAFVTDDINYILKRKVSNKGKALSKIQLAFDLEPIVLPFQLQATSKPIALLNTDDPVHQQVLCAKELGNSNTLSFDLPPWRYVAVYPVETDFQGSASVQIDFERIEGGDISLCFVRKDLQSILGREIFLNPGSNQSVEILVEDVQHAWALVVRKGPELAGVTKIIYTTPKSFVAEINQDADLPISLDFKCKNVALATIASAFEAPPTVESDDSLEIINVNDLAQHMDLSCKFRSPRSIINGPMTDFKMELDDAVILRQLFRALCPSKHLEFGTWQGFGAKLVADVCEAEIWTLNLPEGERDESGKPLYASKGKVTDEGSAIGQIYRMAGYQSRVTQLLLDSTKLDVSQFGPAFFDSVLIDGGHTHEVVISDTFKTLEVVKPEGIVLWHDFCPDPDVIRSQKASQGVVSAVIEMWPTLRKYFKELYWIRPSWILVGIRNSEVYK